MLARGAGGSNGVRRFGDRKLLYYNIRLKSMQRKTRHARRGGLPGYYAGYGATTIVLTNRSVAASRAYT
jgi:hypothetical protein